MQQKHSTFDVLDRYVRDTWFVDQETEIVSIGEMHVERDMKGLIGHWTNQFGIFHVHFHSHLNQSIPDAVRIDQRSSIDILDTGRLHIDNVLIGDDDGIQCSESIVRWGNIHAEIVLLNRIAVSDGEVDQRFQGKERIVTRTPTGDEIPTRLQPIHERLSDMGLCTGHVGEQSEGGRRDGMRFYFGFVFGRQTFGEGDESHSIRW